MEPDSGTDGTDNIRLTIDGRTYMLTQLDEAKLIVQLEKCMKDGTVFRIKSGADPTNVLLVNGRTVGAIHVVKYIMPGDGPISM